MNNTNRCRTNDELITAFIQQRADHAHCGNLSFDRNVLYSYSQPIANLHPSKLWGNILFLSDDGFSITTKKHRSDAACLFSRYNSLIDARIIYIPPHSLLNPYSNITMDFLMDEIDEQLIGYVCNTRRKISTRIHSLTIAERIIDHLHHLLERREVIPEVSMLQLNNQQRTRLNVLYKVVGDTSFCLDQTTLPAEALALLNTVTVVRAIAELEA